MPGRALATVACLILIALACLTVVRRLDRERRLLGRLRSTRLSVDDLSDDERDTADALTTAGVLRVDRDAYRLDTTVLATYRRKRIRLAIVGALAALLVGAIVVASILIR